MKEEGDSIRLWGKVVDKDGNILSEMPIKLLKKTYKNKRWIYLTIATSRTNEEGVYNFYLKDNKKARYKIVVINKSRKGEIL